MSQKVGVKRLHPAAKLPVRATTGSVGYDLSLVEDVDVRYGELPVLARTGLAVEIPFGWEGQLRLRGSVARKGIILGNAPGTIDSDYRGEVYLILARISPINESPLLCGERVAQVVFKKVELPDLGWAEELSETGRGAGGFGSTGTE